MSKRNSEKKQMEVSYIELQKALYNAVSKNEALREKVIQNPRESIKNITGLILDKSYDVNFVDLTDPKSITFILPANPKNVYDMEFSNEQLDLIAGGGKIEQTTNQNVNITLGGPRSEFNVGGDFTVKGDYTQIILNDQKVSVEQSSTSNATSVF